MTPDPVLCIDLQGLDPTDPLDPNPAGGSGGAALLGRPDPLGWRQARQALIAAGACPLAASEAWVANHYRWIVWKLAAHTRVLLANSPALPQRGGGGGALHLPLGVPAASVEAAVDAAAGSCGEAAAGSCNGAAFSDSAVRGPCLAVLAWHEVVAQLQHRCGAVCTSNTYWRGAALTSCPPSLLLLPAAAAGCAERPAGTALHSSRSWSLMPLPACPWCCASAPSSPLSCRPSRCEQQCE